jgi:hypothetical protein
MSDKAISCVEVECMTFLLRIQQISVLNWSDLLSVFATNRFGSKEQSFTVIIRILLGYTHNILYEELTNDLPCSLI